MEISGCFALWALLRQSANPLWLLPGVGALIVFAFLLTLAPAAFAGRANAASGGVHIRSALIRGWLAVLAAAVFRFGPRAA